jgi:hypothetical protein
MVTLRRDFCTIPKRNKKKQLHNDDENFCEIARLVAHSATLDEIGIALWVQLEFNTEHSAVCSSNFESIRFAGVRSAEHRSSTCNVISSMKHAWVVSV